MGVPGRVPTGRPTRDRNPRVHEFTDVISVPFQGGPALPTARPDGRPWPSETVRWWAAVSTMPHAKLWTAAEWSFALDTAIIAAAFHAGDLKSAAELRLREKDMGTTHVARMSARIRYIDPPGESGDPAEVANLADYRNL